MSEKERVLRSTINYYGYKGFYRSMLNWAAEGCRLYPGDQKYRFYNGLALAFSGRTQESIRDLDMVHEHRDLCLGALHALIYVHRQCKTVDKEAISQLESTLREGRKNATESSLYFAGLFLLFAGKFDKARDYIDRMYKMSSQLREGQMLKGWLELHSAIEPDEIETAGAYFDTAANLNDAEGLLGRAAAFEKAGQYGKAVEVLNKSLVYYHGFVPAFIEKTKMLVALKDWDEALDTIHRVQSIDRHCIDTARFAVLHCLIWDTQKIDQAIEKLKDLNSTFEVREPNNVRLCLQTARLFSRLADRNKEVINATFLFAERAALLDANNPDVYCELGHQCILMNNLSDAQRHFKTATKLDDSNLSALVGLLYCTTLMDDLNTPNSSALEQLEALEEFNQADGLSPELLYLCALTGERRGRSEEEVIKYLDQIAAALNSRVAGLPLGLDLYLKLDPEMATNVARLYLDYAPIEPLGHGQQMPPVLKMAHDVLQPVVNACPSLKEPLYLMSHIKYISGDSAGALSLLEKCLEDNQSFSNGYLLKAKLLLAQGHLQTASQCLEMALSHSFQIREEMDYVLTKTLILKQEKKYEEALKCLQNVSKQYRSSTTMAMPTSTGHSVGTGQHLSLAKTKRNKISHYLLMVELYDLLDQPNEAGKLLDELDEEFKGTADEGRILIAKALSAENKGSTDQALSVLRTITVDHGEYFVKSRERMAYIYLKYRKDRRLYASCYREILEKVQSTQSYLMLGDAYMNILEPERAIETYEQCLKKNPKDGYLTRKVGQALVKTHLFEKAITYYKAAIKTSGHYTLRYDLAQLLYRMKRYQEASDVIRVALERMHLEGKDLTILVWKTKLTHLLAQVQLDSRDTTSELAIDTLRDTHVMHGRVMRRVPIEQPDLWPEQKALAIKIASQLAEIYTSFKEFDQAKRVYKDGVLNYDPENVKVLSELTKLEMATNNFEEAQRYTQQIIRFAPDDDTSLLMLADLMFRRPDFEGALAQFHQLLEKKPTCFPAMARFIEAARRLGRLVELVPAVLEKAERISARFLSDPKYNYCKGLYQWYTGSSNEAMKCFNIARADEEFGLNASYHMVEICINPDSDVLGGETFGLYQDHSMSYERISAQDNAIKTAEKILQEIEQKANGDIDYQLMTNFVKLARPNQKNEYEYALQQFSMILNDERFRDNVGAILGAATAQMLLRAPPKARNMLKRTAKMHWNFMDAEVLEKCWLLLADVYTNSAKYDIASDLLRKCITYNRSCVKAFEYQGYILEKESNYNDACASYEHAYRLTRGNNPMLGYKLAFNYLKEKRYVDAIDVARQLLEKFPEYPKVRKEILEKARNNLRG